MLPEVFTTDNYTKKTTKLFFMLSLTNTTPNVLVTAGHQKHYANVANTQRMAYSENIYPTL